MNEFNKININYWNNKLYYLKSQLNNSEHKLRILKQRKIDIPKDILKQKEYIKRYKIKILKLENELKE